MTELFERSAPISADAHLVDARRPAPVRARRKPPLRHRRCDLARCSKDRQRDGDDASRTTARRAGRRRAAYVDDAPLAEPPVRALSLAVAQKCNLGCTYCYADGGDFGGPAANMPLETALAAVDLLLPRRRRASGSTSPSSAASRCSTGRDPGRDRARRRARPPSAASQVGFSITTNGTLLTAEDGDFFEAHGFAVTVSLDGLGAVHDRLRPFPAGAAASTRIMRTGRAAAGAAAPDAGLRARDGDAAEPRAARDARRFRRARIPQRRLLAAAALADRPRRDGPRRSGDDARRDDRLRPRVRAPGRRRASAIRSPTSSTRCARSTAARIGRIRAARAPAISACPRMASWPPATASSATPDAAHGHRHRRHRSRRQRGWLAERPRAPPGAVHAAAGRATCAAAAATTR